MGHVVERVRLLRVFGLVGEGEGEVERNVREEVLMWEQEGMIVDGAILLCCAARY